MVKKILVTLIVAFFIFPPSAFAGEVDYTKNCILQGEKEIVFTSPKSDIDFDTFPDSGIAQIYSQSKKVNGGYKYEVTVKYMATVGEIRKYYKTVDWVKEKTKDMSDTDKVKCLNEYFQKNTKYGTGNTAMDAVVRGRANCEGYAFGFQVLAKEIGLESSCVWGDTGTGIHAWNEVEINGDKYGVDTCWNEILKEPNSWSKHKKCDEYNL